MSRTSPPSVGKSLHAPMSLSKKVFPNSIFHTEADEEDFSETMNKNATKKSSSIPIIPKSKGLKRADPENETFSDESKEEEE